MHINHPFVVLFCHIILEDTENSRALLTHNMTQPKKSLGNSVSGSQGVNILVNP